MFDSVKQAIITALPIAFLFFAGWAFLNAYLGRFGIDITEVDLSLQTILVFAFRPLNNWWAALAAPAYAGLLYYGLMFWRSIEVQEDVFISVGFAALALIVGFKILDVLAVVSAKTASEQVWSGGRVRVDARLSPEEEARYDLIVTDYLACRARRGFVHVFSTTSESFLLCRSINEPEISGMLYTIDNAGLVSSRRKIRSGP